MSLENLKTPKNAKIRKEHEQLIPSIAPFP